MAGVRSAEGGVKPEAKVAAGLGLLAITCGVISLLSPDANRHDGQPVPGSGDTGPTAGELTPFVPAWLEVGDSCDVAPMAVFPVSGVNVGVLCNEEALTHTIANLEQDVVVIDPRPVIDLSSEGWQQIPGIDRLIPVIEDAGVFTNPDGVVQIGVFSHTYFEDGQVKRGFGLLFPNIRLPGTLTMVNLPEGLLNDPSLCTLVETGEYRCNLPVVGYNHEVAAGLVPVEAEGVPLVVRGVILQVDEDGVLQQVDFNGKEYKFGGGHLAAPAPVFSPAIVEPLPESPTATLAPATDSGREELLTEVADARRSILEPPEPETPIPPTAAVEPPTAVALPPEVQPTEVQPAPPSPTPEQYIEADGTVRPDWIPIPDDLIRIDYIGDGHWGTVSYTDCRAGRENDSRFQLDPRFVYERAYVADANNPPGVYYDCTFNLNKLTMVVIWTVN